MRVPRGVIDIYLMFFLCNIFGMMATYFGKRLLIASERCVHVSEVLYHDFEGMCIEMP